MTPVTSVTWRITLQVASVVNPEVYYWDLDPELVTRTDILNLVKNLTSLGYDNVNFSLIVVLP